MILCINRNRELDKHKLNINPTYAIKISELGFTKWVNPIPHILTYNPNYVTPLIKYITLHEIYTQKDILT